jgi:uncharacterized protein YjbJ (UPF0337 family)
MDKDRIKGSAIQAKGKVKEVWQVLGDSKLESEGKGDQVKGKMQSRRRHQGYTARQVAICCCVAKTEPHLGLCFLSGVVCLKWVTSGHSAHELRCPLYSRKRTLARVHRMSALCQ